ncbi:MAG: Hsp33 family molecular chaperone HslO [Methylotenera sp.]|nr:Hsp33 family molecular chaperone HslO [Methylotenera sp.]
MEKLTDSLQRFIFEDTPVRGSLVNLTHTLQLALNKQELPQGLKRALGELMAASALLTATLKMHGALVLQIQAKGPLKLLVVECSSEFGIRATVKWSGEIQDTQTLFDVLVQGQFMITLDPKDGGQTYQGIVALEGDSISTILENYMLRSEQIDTKIWLSCDGNTAAGMLLQKLPDTMNQITHEHDIDTWNRVGHLADTITDEELLQLPTETLLHRLFHEENVRLFEASHTKFYCSCSRKNVAGMLRMLGDEELKSILQEQGKIDINCDFCGAHYQFDAVDATQLFASEITPQSSKKIH